MSQEQRPTDPLDRLQEALAPKVAPLFQPLDTTLPASQAILAVGRRVGGYTILREIGYGGMGVVYEAEQEHPRRRVALKAINPGVTSPKALRRFEHEAEILGRLQHPGIAQIFEAGTFDAGAGPQPFFAMEFIEGRPLTDFAAESKLSTRHRLELMAKVCQGVHHAHQKGVIHRDLKPGNILVDSTGQPKILDFGVARATESDIQTATRQTDVGQLIGTVPYMSPEQAGGDPHDLDARSDVYALGIVAYELLAGRLPYDLRKKMIHEAVRVIQEEDPTPLSSVDRVFRGDVEIMVGKALAKEKERRYQSADEFASDIGRYLKDEPITARPPSAVYQLCKFARRNKVLVGGAAATFLVLIVGLVTSTTLYVRAEAQRQRAVLAEREQSRERERAEHQRKLAEQVAEFQASQLSGIDAALMGVRLRGGLIAKRRAVLEGRRLNPDAIEADLRELEQALAGVNFTNVALETLDENIFESALNAIEKNFADQPLVKARLLQTVADTLRELGLLDKATAPQTEALDLRRRALGDDHPDTVNSINSMGVLLHGQGRLAEAEPYVREALQRCRRVLGENHPDALGAINNMGNLLQAQGKLDQAEPLFREAMERSRRVLGDDHPTTLVCIISMAFLLQAQGKPDQAEPFFREALERSRRVLGDDHPSTLAIVVSMGPLLLAQGKLAEAEPYYRMALESSRRVLGNDHPATLTSINNMGGLLVAQGRFAEAEPLYREAAGGLGRQLGSGHWQTGSARASLARVLVGLDRFAEAEEHLLAGERILRQAQGVPAGWYDGSVKSLIKLYDNWHAAEPDGGHDAKAAEWRAKLAEWQATTQPTGSSSSPSSTAQPSSQPTS